MDLLNYWHHQRSLDKTCAMQHHANVSSILLQENRFSPLPSGLFFGRTLSAGSRRRSGGLAHRKDHRQGHGGGTLVPDQRHGNGGDDGGNRDGEEILLQRQRHADQG